MIVLVSICTIFRTCSYIIDSNGIEGQFYHSITQKKERLILFKLSIAVSI